MVEQLAVNRSIADIFSKYKIISISFNHSASRYVRCDLDLLKPKHPQLGILFTLFIPCLPWPT